VKPLFNARAVDFRPFGEIRSHIVWRVPLSWLDHSSCDNLNFNVLYVWRCGNCGEIHLRTRYKNKIVYPSVCDNPSCRSKNCFTLLGSEELGDTWLGSINENTNNTKTKKREEVNFAGVYYDLGASLEETELVKECGKYSYGVDCCRCGTKFYLPIRDHNKYLCKTCRERENKRQRGEVNDVFLNLYEGVRRCRHLEYGRRFKFLHDTFTLPKELSEKMVKNSSMINRFMKVIRRTMTRFYGGQVGAFNNDHEWATRLPWDKHNHVDVIFPNIVRVDKTKGIRGFKYVHHFLSEKELDEYREVYTEELNREFDLNLEVATVNHAYIKNLRRYFHTVNYMVRNVYDDFERGFIGSKNRVKINYDTGELVRSGWVVWKNEYKKDMDFVFIVPNAVMSEIMEYRTEKYKKRYRWFGWLGDSVKTKNLALFNVRRVKKGKVRKTCKFCGGDLVVNRDEIYTSWDKELELDGLYEHGRWDYWIEVDPG